MLTPAIRRILEFAKSKDGSFTFWPAGLVARRTIRKAVTFGYLEERHPAGPVGMLEHHLTDAGRAALAKGNDR